MKKKNMFLIVMGLLMISFSFSNPSQAALQMFESGNSGWLNVTVDDSGNLGYSSSVWSGTGGNPGGHISGSVDNDAIRLYGIQAPFETDFFGDLTGQTLTVDYKITGTVNGPTDPYVRFYFGYYDGQSRYWVSNDSYSWDPNNEINWTTHQVQLLESNFTQWPNQNKGDKTFEEVLQDYNDIGLVFADGFTSNSTLGFSSADGATIHVDNFGVVPIPGAVWLLGSGLIGLVGLRKRFNAN